jgi:Tripartite tricarboxylate transporter family receptor
VIPPSMPIKTVAEFIAYGKANPGKISFASSGNGTSVHMSGGWWYLRCRKCCGTGISENGAQAGTAMSTKRFYARSRAGEAGPHRPALFEARELG